MLNNSRAKDFEEKSGRMPEIRWNLRRFLLLTLYLITCLILTEDLSYLSPVEFFYQTQVKKIIKHLTCCNPYIDQLIKLRH